MQSGTTKIIAKKIYFIGFIIVRTVHENSISLIPIFFRSPLKTSNKLPKGHIQPHQNFERIIEETAKIKNHNKFCSPI